MTIGLFANPLKKDSLNISKTIIEILKEHDLNVVGCEEISDFTGIPLIQTVSLEDISFLISLGGDGTMLQLIHSYPDLKLSFLGINLGKLGFMTDFSVEDLRNAFLKILKGKYFLLEQIVIQGMLQEKDFFAVNDVVLHRGRNHSLVEISIFVDDIYLNTFSSDGIILATPNGSTAYSLSSGGPILSPEVSALVITPICPHVLSSRPIVIYPESFITIEYTGGSLPIDVTCDGIFLNTLKPKEAIRCRIHNEKLKIIKKFEYNYFKTLRHKLGWTGTISNKKL